MTKQTAPDATAMPGGRPPSTTLEDVREVFADREDRAEPLTATEIAERVGCSRRTAHDKLEALAEQRALATKKVGARGRVWWVPRPAAESPTSDGAAAVASGPASSPHGNTSTPTAPESAGQTDGEASRASEAAAAGGADREGPSRERLEAAVDAWAAAEWEDTPDRLAARKQAAVAVLEYALEHGGIGKSTAEAEVYPDHPVPGQQFETWWRKNVRELLGEVGEYDNGAHAYRVNLEALETLAGGEA